MMVKLKLLLAVCCLFAAAIVLVQATTVHAQDSLYDIDVQPLAIEDCARCHTSHFGWLKNNGALHQTVACTECHQQFHVYNPLKNNYAEIMPKCSQCHDLPHGEIAELPPCLNCHTNPHQPIASIPEPTKLEKNCMLCHAPISQMLANKPSKHTERYCSECHSQKHGRIPDCSECHESHSPMLPLLTADCLTCHPVHTPLEISYPSSQAMELCAGCHEEVYITLKASTAKHTTLTCAYCHPTHGEIPECSRCHGAAPHNPTMHEKFPDCLFCHNNPHDLSI